MNVFNRTIRRVGSQRSFSALRLPFFAGVVVVALAGSQPLLGQGTHLWTQSRVEEFEKGTPQGVALTSDGHLREGPAMSEVLTTPSTFVWSVAVDKNGTSYLGTASPATVLRVGADSKPFTLFETRDLSVQVVRLGPDGALYAATLPSGKVYRLKPDATIKQDDASATVVFDAAAFEGGHRASDKADATTGGGRTDDGKNEAKSHYIWDLTFDAAGQLYIATGGPGAVYRVDVAKSGVKAAEEFFKSDEAHIRCLAWDAKGNLIAGSDGSGLVYQINPQGKGYVLFEAPKREVTAVAVAANGTIYAANVGDKSHNPLPPLPVQGQGSITITVVQPGSLQAANSSTSLPEGSEIYALTPPSGDSAQAPRKIWSGKDEIVYALAAQADGLLGLTGNRGRVFKIADDGSYADVAHLEAQQGLSLAVTETGLLIGTGNSGKLIRFGGAASQHEYASDVLDAGALARFGRVEVEPGSTGYELWTRTGNVEQPVRGWSDWQQLKDGAVASPAGRFFEWKAALHAGASLGSVGVNYLPVNSAPVVDELMVTPGARVNAQAVAQNPTQMISLAFPSSNQGVTITYDSNANSPLQALKDRTAITVRWAAHDDDGDDLIYSLYLRGDGEKVWRLLKDQITDKFYSFDATLIPDGGYEIKVVASDAPSHSPGEALSSSRESERFEVDTTPPVMSGLRVVEGITCGGAPCWKFAIVTFDAEDAFSPIAHAEYSIDAGTWQYIEPVGGLSDSKREHYQVTLKSAELDGKPGEHLITVRVYDRHDNVGVAKTVFSVPAKK